MAAVQPIASSESASERAFGVAGMEVVAVVVSTEQTRCPCPTRRAVRCCWATLSSLGGELAAAMVSYLTRPGHHEGQQAAASNDVEKTAEKTAGDHHVGVRGASAVAESSRRRRAEVASADDDPAGSVRLGEESFPGTVEFVVGQPEGRRKGTALRRRAGRAGRGRGAAAGLGVLEHLRRFARRVAERRDGPASDHQVWMFSTLPHRRREDDLGSHQTRLPISRARSLRRRGTDHLLGRNRRGVSVGERTHGSPDRRPSRCRSCRAGAGTARSTIGRGRARGDAQRASVRGQPLHVGRGTPPRRAPATAVVAAIFSRSAFESPRCRRSPESTSS